MFLSYRSSFNVHYFRILVVGNEPDPITPRKQFTLPEIPPFETLIPRKANEFTMEEGNIDCSPLRAAETAGPSQNTSTEALVNTSVALAPTRPTSDKSLSGPISPKRSQITQPVQNNDISEAINSSSPAFVVNRKGDRVLTEAEEAELEEEEEGDVFII